MSHILAKEKLSENVYLMKLHAPLIAQERKAGQFVMLQLDDDLGERIPLTIANANLKDGSITINHHNGKRYFSSRSCAGFALCCGHFQRFAIGTNRRLKTALRNRRYAG